jgi:hypothetical protein
MLEFLRGRAADRKLRLFAVACCRRTFPLLTDESSRAAVDRAEQFADRAASYGELYRAARRASEVPQDPSYPVAPPHSAVHASEHARVAAQLVAAAPDNDLFTLTGHIVGYSAIAASGLAGDADRGNWHGEMTSRMASENQAQAALVRDVFGPLPFRPVTVQPHALAWNDRLVVRLAQSIYDERRWGGMPILGDALLDAGCDDDEVVAHCRAGVGHVRGCWIVDLCLGRCWERSLSDEHPPFGHYPPRPDAVRVVLSGGPLSGFEVGVMPPLPAVIRVNAPRYGNHRVWITCTYAFRGQQYEHIRTENASVGTIC